MPQIITQTDTDDLFDWSTIITQIADNGDRIQRDWEYDDGSIRTDIYDAGVITETRKFDSSANPDANPWDVVRVYYDNGVIVGSEITYDDTSAKIEIFENGVRSQLTELDSTTVPGTRDWERIDTYYDANGDLAGRETLYDTGERRLETYEFGALSQITQLDETDVQDWIDIQTYYDNGLIAGQVITYDDGREVARSYDSGAVSREDQYDRTAAGDPAGQEWERISTYYEPDGALAGRETEFDDGVLRLDYYSDGALSRVSQTDRAGDARIWQSHNTYFEANGDKAGIEIDYDDGRFETIYFSDGIKSRQELIDRTQSGDPAGQGWDSQTTYFEVNGDKAYRETQFDNGVLKQETFDGGQIFTVEQFDTGNAKTWDSIVIRYDAQGRIAAKEVTNDNGLLREETFVDGQRYEVNEQDTGNAFGWDSRLTSYNVDEGYVNGKFIAGDNGINTSLGYDQGVLSVREQADTFDITPWDLRVRVYGDDGKVDTFQTSFDNGDQRVISYAEDGRTQAIRIDQDGDASHEWTFKVVDMRGATNVVTTYDSFDELSADYQDVLNFSYTVSI